MVSKKTVKKTTSDEQPSNVIHIDDAPQLTVERFVRTLPQAERETFGEAFIHIEKLSGKVRRMNKDAWSAVYSAFKTAPRR